MNISALPEGTPITMRIDFSASDLIDLNVSTKVEATSADEERIHDLYVLIFCKGEGQGHVPGNKIYGRYFSYEHLESTLSALDGSPNEGWWVENRNIQDPEHPERYVSKTKGAVKISTKVCSEAIVVVIANIDNGVCQLGKDDNFGNDMLAFLNGIRTYEEFRKTQVKLTQDVVNRKDLFLMMGFPEDGSRRLRTVNTGSMIWGTNPSSPSYDPDYKINLRAVDAKVKFKVRINDPNNNVPYISAAKAVYWQVCNTPDRCFLFSDYAPDGSPVGTVPQGTIFFDTEQAYFEGTEGEWYVFSFYMLESRFGPKAHATDYYQREKQVKTVTQKDGYGVNDDQYGQYYVENGEWIYASPYAPYVKFDMILTLTPEGVQALGGNVNHALTSDTIYSIHLGDFSNESIVNRFDDYNTYRSTCYTYEITIANAGSIYAEVIRDKENQPGQEGYLLLTDDEIVNADCHYEYHAITFTYDPETSPEKFSWYVKTPFTSQVGGGPQKGFKEVNGVKYPIYDPHDSDGTLLDYRWVKFSINEKDPTTGYSTHRVAYPGDKAYTDHKDWGVGENGPWNNAPHPVLMDISQLIQYIFQETDKEKAESGSSDFELDTELGKKVIRATIFIDEYYYETDPRDESENPRPDPNLWRQFVNAQPREMHVLSKTVQSRDRKSDVIESSHSVIQQSIQTIYNVYEPSLRSIWGCEHLDEIKYTTEDGQPQSNPAGNWTYWPAGCSDTEKAGANDNIGKENGRLNSAFIWGLYSSKGNGGQFWEENGEGKRYWKHFLKYEVNNSVPELRDDMESDHYGDDGTTHKFRGMAWSCLTRNRDNNGNGRIDEEEVRWYLASSQQLTGIWVGTESLSTSARLYQPVEGQWRSHVMSSTAKKVAWAEEGAGATDYIYDYAGGDGQGGPSTDYHTWASQTDAAVGESVRCLRNIGTYDGPEGITDISYAPVTVLPDQYFTLERSDGGSVSDYDNNDAYYIFYFDRLSTKSIREFSPGELPYHDQMSLNNRVYMKIITQPLNNVVASFSKKHGEINNLVTQAGHNDYCPEGYRFPNHTEWLLMELYLPDSYLKKSGYSGVYPSRTYYDRGYFGSLRSTTAAWSTEKDKVGWTYSNKMHCTGFNVNVTRSRCVKDEDQTGVISGKMAIESQEIYPGDLIPIDFKFSSTASAFSDATLTLWYKKNGRLLPYDLTLKAPTGVQYKGVQYIRIPTLTDLGLSAGDLPVNSGLEDNDMAIEVTFKNMSNSSGGDKIPVKMINPLDGICSITDAFDGNKIFPSDQNAISLRLYTIAHDLNLSGATLKLCYDSQDITVETIPALVDGKPTKSYTRSSISIPALSSLTGISVADLNAGDKTVTLKATVSMTYANTNVPGTETLTKEFTQTLSLSNPVIANSFAIADAASSKLYPGDRNHVSLSFESRGHNETLSAASLKLMKGEIVVADYSSSLTQPDANAYTVNNFEIAIPSLSQSLALDDALRLVAIVGNADGLSKTLDITNLVLSNPVSGTLTADQVFYPADAAGGSVTFNFTSSANTLDLSSASLWLCYQDQSGVDREIPVTVNTPSGKTYSGAQSIAIPDLTAQNLNLSGVNLNKPITLKARVGVSNDLYHEVTLADNTTLKSHISADFTIQKGASIPVNVLTSLQEGATITSSTLQWSQDGGSSWNDHTLNTALTEQTINTTSDLAGFTPFTPNAAVQTEQAVQYKLIVSCSDGTSVISPIGSVTVRDYGFEPNDNAFAFYAGNLAFGNGDFIEASIDITGKTSSTYNKDEMIGFGVGYEDDNPSVFHTNYKIGNTWQNNAEPNKTIHAYYRTDLNNANLRFGGWYNDTNTYRNQDVQFTAPLLTIRLDKTGIYYNETKLVFGNNSNVLSTTNLNNIIQSDHLMIGAAQGSDTASPKSRSNAHYNYINIVRQPLWPEL